MGGPKPAEKTGGGGGNTASTSSGSGTEVGKRTLAFPEMIDRDRTKATIDQKDKGGVRPVFGKLSGDFGEPTGEEGVSFLAPTVRLSADVFLVKDCEPDPAAVDVGWVQVVESSRRIAIYERAGKVVHREIASINQSVRDVLTAKDALDGKRFFNPGADRKISLSASTPSGKVEMSDGPSHMFPMTAGGGTLAGMTGQDDFRTSLMVAANGRMEPIRTFQWHVPWDSHVTFGTDKKDKTKKTVTSPDGKPLDLDRNAKLDGSDAKDTSTNGLTAMARFSSYDSESYAADVLAKTPAKFFNALQAAKTADHDSYWNMVGALWKSNKNFRLSIKPDDNDNMDEQFDVEFIGDANIRQSGSARTTFLALGHMVYDPAKLPRSIEVKINGTSIARMGSPMDTQKGSGSITKRSAGFLSAKDFRYTFTLDFE